MRVLAIDQGTSATKAAVLDAERGVLALAEAPVPVIATPDGGVEADPGALWDSVLAAGRAALADAGGAVDAVALSNQGESILPWDRTTGRPLGPVVVWQDRRSAPVCDRLAADGWAPRLAALTGLELDPYFVAPKMAWLRPQAPAGAVLTTTDTWLLHRLAGVFVTDAATASRTLLTDLDTMGWSAEAAAAFGIAVEDLPAIVACDEVVGETALFGDRAVPVVGLCVDQQAALFAERCWERGEAKCTYGTGAFLLTNTGDVPVRSRNGLVGCVAWRTAGQARWCLDGQVYTVGAAVQWLTDIGVIGEPADLDRLGAAVPDAGGAVFVAGLAGLAAPYWRPHAKGAFTGLTLATSRAHLVAAVIEGIAAPVALLVQAAGADLGAPVVRLRVDGGLTRSQTLVQRQADLVQAPVEVFGSPHATVIGVGELALRGLDATAALPALPARLVCEPQMSADEAAGRLAAWQAAAEATMAL